MNRQPLLLRATQGTLAFFVRLAKGVFAAFSAVIAFAVSAIAYGVDHADEDEIKETPLERDIRHDESRGYF